MRVRSILLAMALGAVGLTLAPSAGAQTPSTCLGEVAGGQLADGQDFAGRVRSFAGDDGTIVSRSLLCPYRAEDGRVTELILEWDERAIGRLGCESEGLVLEPGEPTTARMDHGERQAVVLLQGPDEASVRAMEAAAILTLEAVPDMAALCSAGAVARARTLGQDFLLPLAVTLLVLSAAAVIVLLQRRPAASVSAPAGNVPLVDAQPSTSGAGIARVGACGQGPRAEEETPAPPAELGEHLVLSAQRAPLDLMASVSVMALLRGRPDLAGIAVSAHRSVGTDRADDHFGPRRRLARQILETAGQPPMDDSARPS